MRLSLFLAAMLSLLVLMITSSIVENWPTAELQLDTAFIRIVEGKIITRELANLRTNLSSSIGDLAVETVQDGVYRLHGFPDSNMIQ